MIKIVKGDLLQAKENIIGHQVNCQGVMGSGVALQIKKKFPVAFQKYIEMVDEYANGDYRKALLGLAQHVPIEGEYKWVSNLFGQYAYGKDGKQYTDTMALYKSFRNVRQFAEFRGLSVALPYKIGSFRGGANWDEVEDLLLTAFNGYEVTLYKLHMG